jgi:hypothetical protein
MTRGLLTGVTLDELAGEVAPAVRPVIEGALVEVAVVEVLVDVGVPVPRT